MIGCLLGDNGVVDEVGDAELGDDEGPAVGTAIDDLVGDKLGDKPGNKLGDKLGAGDVGAVGGFEGDIVGGFVGGLNTSSRSNRLGKFLRNGNTESISESSTPINCPTAFHTASQLVVGSALPRDIMSFPFLVISFGYSPSAKTPGRRP